MARRLFGGKLVDFRLAPFGKHREPLFHVMPPAPSETISIGSISSLSALPASSTNSSWPLLYEIQVIHHQQHVSGAYHRPDDQHASGGNPQNQVREDQALKRAGQFKPGLAISGHSRPV